MNKKIILSLIFASMFISCNKTNTPVKKEMVIEEMVETKPEAETTMKMEMTEKDTTGVLATVDGEKITDKDIDVELEAMPAQYKTYYETEEGREQLLSRVIEQKILKREAVAIGMDKEENYKKEIKAYEERLLASTFITENIFAQVDVSKEELQAKYEENKDIYKQEEEVNTSHILIKTEGLDDGEKSAAKIKAIELLNRALEGTDFAELAKNYSEGPSGPYGGSLGWFGRGRMVKPFEDAAFKGEKGKVYPEIVETRFGYHVIKVEDKKEESYIPFEDIEADLKSEMLNQKRFDAYTNKIEELKAKYGVKISEMKEEVQEEEKTEIK